MAVPRQSPEHSLAVPAVDLVILHNWQAVLNVEVVLLKVITVIARTAAGHRRAPAQVRRIAAGNAKPAR